MKRIVLYPYSRRLSALADYIDLGGEYEIGGLAADRRSGLAGHGSRYGENAEGTYPVTDDLEAALAGSEVLALFEPEGADEAYDVKGTGRRVLLLCGRAGPAGAGSLCGGARGVGAVFV